jgi:hypothetical protein
VGVGAGGRGVNVGGTEGNHSACPKWIVVSARQLTLIISSTDVPVRPARLYSVSPRCT